MNACGFFDTQCRIDAFLAPIWFWLQVGFWCAVGVAVLVVLAWAYRNFGWWGVGIVLTAGISAVAFKKGYDFGKLHGKPLGPTPPVPQRKPKPINPKGDDWLKHLFNGNKF
jgi:hypothetical protein